MLPEERRMFIRELLATQRTVAAHDLVGELGVALATIRRDLAVLEQEGVLVRSHGGAVSKSSNLDFQPPYQVLRHVNIDEKKAIAAAVQPYIQDGEIMFLEGSTTVFEVVEYLVRHNHLTVVTNSPPILNRLMQGSSLTVMSTGGELQRDLHYLGGLWTRELLSKIRFDKAIIGVSAIDPQYGVSTTRPAQAEIKKLLTSVARTRIGLADHTKFGKQNFSFVGPISDFDVIVTSSLTSPDYIAALRDAGVEVIVAQMHKP